MTNQQAMPKTKTGVMMIEVVKAMHRRIQDRQRPTAEAARLRFEARLIGHPPCPSHAEFDAAP